MAAGFASQLMLLAIPIALENQAHMNAIRDDE